MAATAAAKAAAADPRVGETAARIERFIKWYDDPLAYFEEALQAKDSIRKWQRSLLSEIRDRRKAGELHTRVHVRTNHGSGKALALDTPLPTPTGWTTMGEVKAGDLLLNEEGVAVEVTLTSPVELRASSRVTFSDGTSIVASDDHVWQVLAINDCRAARVRARGGVEPPTRDWRERWDLSRPETTATLAASVTEGRVRTTGPSSLKWYVPNTKPLRGARCSFPIPPYTLGFWLGDGTTIRPDITIGNPDAPEVLARIRGEGIDIHQHSNPSDSARIANGLGCKGYWLCGEERAYVRRPDGLRKKSFALWRSAGLLGNKHVPKEILRADPVTRLEVLRGLMDSDGYISQQKVTRQVGVSLSNERLFLGVVELIRTFGWAPTVTTKQPRRGQRVWVASWCPDIQVFGLKRKAEQLVQPVQQVSRPTSRRIVSVEGIGVLPVKCVAVDSPRYLYLAGEGMVPTHNTWLAGGLVNWWQTTRPGARTFTTAPTWDLLSTRLWVEIRKHFQNAIPDVRMGELMPRSAMWHTGGLATPDWFAMGSSSDRPQNLEGLHSWAMARVVDEAKAVPDDVYTATDGMFFGSEETFDLWISTPSLRQGRFYKRDLEGGADLIRKKVTIDDLIADGLPGAEEGKKRFLEDYGGEDSFEYRSRAMAEYIEDSTGVLIPFSWIERAMMTDAEREAAGLEAWHVSAGAPTVGYDVAGSVDGDENATAPVYGPDSKGRFEVGTVDHWHQRDTMISRDRVIETANRIPARCVRADVQGLGKGVCDAIAEKRGERGLSFFVEEYRSADPARDPGRFLNRKAENGWAFRTALEADLIRLPKHPTLREQIASEKYEVRNGKIRIVDNPKDSPDWFDAILMGIGEPIVSFSPDDIGGGDGKSGWNWQLPSIDWGSR